MIKIQTESRIYNGSHIQVSDTYVNARDVRSAVNKLARKLGLRTYGNNEDDIEDLKYDIEYGYYIVEETNYYDENTNEKYKYYVCALYQ